jgi:hypothetical protein
VTTVVRPRRLAVWRLLHGGFAVVCAALAVIYALAGSPGGAVLPAVGALVFGTSAVRAPQRLDRQVGRLALARDRNAPEAGTTGTA